MTTTADYLHVRRFAYPGRTPDSLRHVIKIDCVPTHTEHVIPPDNPDYAYDRVHYRRNVEIDVSPTGRSVRIWVDGTEIPCTK